MKFANIKAFQAYLNRVKQVYQVQGLIVGIFDKEDVLYERIVGYRDVEQALPIDKDTIFGVASITKSFTIVKLLQLAAEGRIDIQAPIHQYYKDWCLAPEHTPTVAQLMSHTGGFFPQERFLMNDVAKKIGIEDWSGLTESQALANEGIKMIIHRLNQTLFFNGHPGQRFSYSNFSFGILTDLVKRYAKEQDYVKAIETGILKPLNMNHSFFNFERTQSEKNITTLYTVDDQKINSSKDYTDMGFVLLGGGALKSTFNDLMAYTRMFLNDGQHDGQQVLPVQWIEEMTKERITYKDHQGYGYGLVTGEIDGLHYVGHSGGLTGVSSFFGFSRDSSKGVVVLCNTGGVPATSIGIAALRLAHNQYPDYRLAQYTESLWSKNVLDHTLGLYESEEGDRVEIQPCGDGVKAIVANEERTCRIINDELLLMQYKMEENYCRILRRANGQAFGLYLGSRIIPKKN